ncbi:MAG TPA: AzlC family ABC transporter permease [Beijerinckiaceae bacterium]|jgi:predicted branched-subunit amino acid permease
MSSPPLTFKAAVHGARLTLPLLPGIMVFATALGAAAVGKGMTFAQVVAMSAFVYAGAAQMVSLELWREAWTPSAVAAVAAVTAVVNARMILMGAAIQPWLAPAPVRRNALQLFFLTDASWLLGTRYHAEGGRDHGMLFGAGIALWVVWVATTALGYLAGALVTDPRRFGLDVLMPVFFAAMLVPLWKGARLALPWGVAGVVALAVQALVPGYLFIIAGALAGMAAGALGDDD